MQQDNSAERVTRKRNAKHKADVIGMVSAGLQGLQCVVLVHGWGGSSHAWDSLTHLFGRETLTVAVDIPGSGLSKEVPVKSVPLMADSILEALSAQSISSFILIGHSMGANIAAQIAINAPDRVSGIVLIDAAFYTDRPFATKIYAYPVIGRPILICGWAFNGMCTWISQRIPKQWRSNNIRIWLHHRRMAFVDNTIAGLQCQMKVLIANPLRLDQLPESLPTVVIHGEYDKVVPASYAEEMFRSRPLNTRLVIIPFADHCPMDMYSADVYKEICLFVASLPKRAYD